MKYQDLLKIVRDEPVFESGLLMAGDVCPKDISKQLSRWTAAGKLIQIRRGLYSLAPPHQKNRPHPFVIANHLVHGSYVSCESALAHYGLIPEYVPVTVSVSISRPGIWESPLGVYQFHHIDQKLHYGYHSIQCEFNQQALIATPEKALLDLIHLKKEGDRAEYLHSLRLQNLDKLNLNKLQAFAEQAKSGKLMRAVEAVKNIVNEQNEETRTL